VPVKLAPLASVLVLTGCLLSLQPIYADRDLVFEPALLGSWSPADAAETWRCTRDERGGYRLRYTDEQGRRAEFSAHLLAVQGRRFLDLAPIALPRSMNALYTDHWIGAHSFAHVVGIEGGVLRLAVLDEDWLKKFLAENPDAIGHATVGGEVVLTASPAETQRFLLAHLDTPGAFRSTLELRRKN
jgi:hypothetical protein